MKSHIKYFPSLEKNSSLFTRHEEMVRSAQYKKPPQSLKDDKLIEEMLPATKKKDDICDTLLNQHDLDKI